METDTIEITGISPELLRKLDERAKQSGSDRAGYIRHLIEKDVESISLRELFAPIRQEMEAEGITEEELDDLIEEAREESYQKREGRTK